MAICALFGPEDGSCPHKEDLRNLLVTIIEKHGVDRFYIGNEGPFDALVRWLLYELSREYSVRFTVILAQEPRHMTDPEYADAWFPEELRDAAADACLARDCWMERRSDIQISVLHPSEDEFQVTVKSRCVPYI